VEPPRFSLTPLGAGLRPDVPASMRPPVLHLLDPSLWESWGCCSTACNVRRHR
jgi:hypothetical protein